MQDITILTLQINVMRDISEFVTITNRIKCDVTVKKDRYVLDGKSILGMWSINFAEPFDVIIEGECSNELIENLKKWEVK